MPTLKDIRLAIKTTLTAAVADTSVYTRVPASVTVPAILVLPSVGDYQIVHGNAGTGWEFDLVVLAPSADEEVAQDVLDDYVDARGDKSIVAAVHTNSGLGRPDCSAVVRRLSNYGIRYAVGGTEYIGATLRLFVLATHS